MLRSEKKKVISKFATHPKDTGSPQVQVAVLTERINKLQEHLLAHGKDNHSRKGLLELVGKRRRHLNYLRLHNKKAYEELLGSLKLKAVSQTTSARKTVKKGPKAVKGEKKVTKASIKAEKKAEKKAVKKEKKAVKKATATAKAVKKAAKK